MRLGPQMQRAASIVAANPGCTMLFVARQLHQAARNGLNMGLGYEPIHRAIAAGLIRTEPNPRRRGTHLLFPVQETP